MTEEFKRRTEGILKLLRIILIQLKPLLKKKLKLLKIKKM